MQSLNPQDPFDQPETQLIQYLQNEIVLYICGFLLKNI